MDKDLEKKKIEEDDLEAVSGGYLWENQKEEEKKKLYDEYINIEKHAFGKDKYYILIFSKELDRWLKLYVDKDEHEPWKRWL